MTLVLDIDETMIHAVFESEKLDYRQFEENRKKNAILGESKSLY
jgi:hypothetical protein